MVRCAGHAKHLSRFAVALLTSHVLLAERWPRVIYRRGVPIIYGDAYKKGKEYTQPNIHRLVKLHLNVAALHRIWNRKEQYALLHTKNVLIFMSFTLRQ